MTHRARWPWFGFAFGCVLFVFAFGSAGYGHGTFLPFAIFAAPLSLIPLIGLLAAPVWWGAVGWLLKQHRVQLSALLMLMHSVAVGLVLWLGTPGEPGTEQWRYFLNTQRAMPLWLWSGIVVYGIGLVISWLVIARSGLFGDRTDVDPDAG